MLAGCAGDGRVEVCVVVGVEGHVVRMGGWNDEAGIDGGGEVEEDVGSEDYSDHHDLGENWLCRKNFGEKEVFRNCKEQYESNLRFN